MTTPRILVDKETGEEFEVCGGFMDPDGILDVIRPIPKPEKSLEEEVLKEVQSVYRDAALKAKERDPYLDIYNTSTTIVLSSEACVLCRVLDRRFKEMKK